MTGFLFWANYNFKSFIRMRKAVILFKKTLNKVLLWHLSFFQTANVYRKYLSLTSTVDMVKEKNSRPSVWNYGEWTKWLSSFFAGGLIISMIPSHTKCLMFFFQIIDALQTHSNVIFRTDYSRCHFENYIFVQTM